MPRKVIGLDPGKHALKAVEVEHGFRGHELIRRLRVQRTAENGDLSSLLQDILSEGRIEGDVWTSFPLAEVTARLIRVPFSKASKLDKIVPYELEGSVPFGAEEMIVDHHSIDRQKSSSWLLAAGAKRERIAVRLEELAGAGVNPRGLVPEGYAYRSLARLIQPEPGAPYAFLDIGASHSIFTAGLGDRVIAGRSISMGGDSITEALASKLSISNEEAEKLKVNAGVHNSVLLEAAEKALKPLAMQVHNSLRFLKAEEGISPEKIFICGGTARLEKIAPLMGKMVGIPCEVVALPGGPAADLGPEDSHALALALEDMSAVHGVNFRKDEFAYRSEKTVFREKLLFPSILALLLIVFLNINSLIKNRIRQEQLALLKANITAIAQAVMPGENLPPDKVADKIRGEITRIKKLEENLGQLTGLTPLEFLTAISELIPPNVKVDIETITMSEKTISIEGVIPEHSDMDIIIEKLKTFKAFKRFDTPDLRPKVGGGVKFTLRIFLTTEEEGEGGP